MIKLLKQNVPFTQNKRTDKKDVFNSNKKYLFLVQLILKYMLSIMHY